MMRAPFAVALLAGLALLGAGGTGQTAEPDPDLAAAEKTLQEAGVAADGPNLVKFFRQRTLSKAERKKLGGLVPLLGHESFQVRRKASKDLLAAGRAALPFLRPAVKDPDPEIAQSAKRLVMKLESGSDMALTVAAARVLAARKPADAVPALLAYLPMTDEETTEEAVFDALAALGVADGKVDPELTAALKDKDPLRRAAAAYVQGKAGLEPRKALAPLLADPDARVRFQAAAALVRAGDKAAVPPLVSLLGEPSPSLAGLAEDLLLRIAGERAPPTSPGTTDAERKKWRDKWADWWKANGAGVDLAKINFQDTLRGLTLVCDCDTGKGTGGKLWEFGADGKERWEFTAVRTVVDVQLLPAGRLLVAEGSTSQVTERDRQGKVLWSHPTNGYATTVRRLPNGNTLFAGYGGIGEVTRDGKVVFTYRTAGGSIYRVQRLRNGNLLFACNGQVVEIDRTGKQVRSVAIPGGTGIWTHVELLPSGRYLVAQYSANKVIELDADGRVHWQVSVTTPSSASRLPNGHVLVSSMDGRRLVEFNREGKEVWQMKAQGRPFLVRRY
jgi:hypothetical protein